MNQDDVEYTVAVKSKYRLRVITINFFFGLVYTLLLLPFLEYASTTPVIYLFFAGAIFLILLIGIQIFLLISYSRIPSTLITFAGTHFYLFPTKKKKFEVPFEKIEGVIALPYFHFYLYYRYWKIPSGKLVIYTDNNKYTIRQLDDVNIIAERIRRMIAAAKEGKTISF